MLACVSSLVRSSFNTSNHHVGPFFLLRHTGLLSLMFLRSLFSLLSGGAVVTPSATISSQQTGYMRGVYTAYLLEGFEIIFENPSPAGSLRPCWVIFQVTSNKGKRNHVLARQLVLHWIPTGALKAIQVYVMSLLRAYSVRHQWQFAYKFIQYLDIILPRRMTTEL